MICAHANIAPSSDRTSNPLKNTFSLAILFLIDRFFRRRQHGNWRPRPADRGRRNPLPCVNLGRSDLKMLRHDFHDQVIQAR
jgi:hypothetical protein